MHVLGTAGHVDHGKSSLLKALTGMEPDRLPEEKRRGMTIDLNHVSMRMASGAEIGIVDVPGHARYLKNLISGFCQIDAVLFVVALDDGWMPQSEEHLDLIMGLGVERGIVVFTKTDLVDDEWKTAMVNDVLARIQSRVQREWRHCFFSTKNQSSVEKVKAEVEKLVAFLPEPRDLKSPRIWIDRVFSPKGQGAVVTGTLREGELKTGDALTLYPSGKVAHVRTLQSYHHEVDVAKPVCRVAINLTGPEISEYSRGMLLQANRPGVVTRNLLVQFSKAIPTFPRNQQVAFYNGTLREVALATRIGDDHSRMFRIRTSIEIPARSGDSIAVRSSGDERLIGTGTIVEPIAQKSERRLREALSKWEPTVKGYLRLRFSSRGLVDLGECLAATSFSKTVLENELLSDRWQLLGVEKFVERDWWHSLGTGLRDWFHQKSSPTLDDGEVRKWLMKRVRATTGLRELVWEGLFATGVLLRVEGVICHREEKRKLSPEETSSREKIAAWLLSGKGEPVSIKAPNFGDNKMMRQALEVMVRSGLVVSLDAEHFIEGARFRTLREKVIEKLRVDRSASTSVLREWLGFSRKNAVLILEKLDADRVTYLKEGVRMLLKIS